MPEHPYSPHDRLVASARGGSALWRLVAGVIALAAITFGLNLGFSDLLRQVAPAVWADLAGPEGMGNTPVSMLLILFSFALALLALSPVLRLVHRRTLASVIGPVPETLRQFWRTLRILLVIGLITLLPMPWMTDDPVVPNLPLWTWLGWLPLALVGLLIQTGTEEVLFRGYLQQQLAARFRSPLIWIGVPSLLFAMGHYLPVEAGANAVPIAIWAGVFGLLMADLTARAGTLGPAVAVHFMNNLGALLIVSLPDSLSGLALYTTPFSMADSDRILAYLPLDFLGMIVFWLAARLAIRR